MEVKTARIQNARNGQFRTINQENGFEAIIGSVVANDRG